MCHFCNLIHSYPSNLILPLVQLRGCGESVSTCSRRSMQTYSAKQGTPAQALGNAPKHLLAQHQFRHYSGITSLQAKAHRHIWPMLQILAPQKLLTAHPIRYQFTFWLKPSRSANANGNAQAQIKGSEVGFHHSGFDLMLFAFLCSF